MGSRLIDRRRQRTPFLFANDSGSVERDRRDETRRESLRYKVQLWVELKTEAQEDIQLVYATELSISGIFINCNEPLELNARVQVLMNLPNVEQPVVALAKVASIRLLDTETRAAVGNGIQFIEMSSKGRKALLGYLKWIEERDAPPIDLNRG